jgi:hypothetical protein
MVENPQVSALKASLAADGYELSITSEGDAVSVAVSAGPAACAECLVPKPIFRSILARAMGVGETTMTLTYPGEQHQAYDHD